MYMRSCATPDAPTLPAGAKTLLPLTPFEVVLLTVLPPP
jgi:hypothetical protein